MSGPLIFVVRLLSLISVVICISLFLRSSPPLEAMVIIGGVLVGIAALWAKAERQRAGYKNQLQKDRSKSSASKSLEPSFRVERVIEHHHYLEKEQKSNIVIIIGLIASLCVILGFLRSCIS